VDRFQRVTDARSNAIAQRLPGSCNDIDDTGSERLGNFPKRWHHDQ
jgi:hypothetical protein